MKAIWPRRGLSGGRRQGFLIFLDVPAGERGGQSRGGPQPSPPARTGGSRVPMAPSVGAAWAPSDVGRAFPPAVRTSSRLDTACHRGPAEGTHLHPCLPLGAQPAGSAQYRGPWELGSGQKPGLACPGQGCACCHPSQSCLRPGCSWLWVPHGSHRAQNNLSPSPSPVSCAHTCHHYTLATVVSRVPQHDTHVPAPGPLHLLAPFPACSSQIYQGTA